MLAFAGPDGTAVTPVIQVATCAKPLKFEKVMKDTHGTAAAFPEWSAAAFLQIDSDGA